MARTEQTNNEGGDIVERLPPDPAILLALEFQYRPEQDPDMFAELDRRGIERLVCGALERDRTQHAIAFAQGHRADRVLTVLARQCLMSAYDMFLFLPVQRWNHDDRLLIDRLVHRQFDSANEVRPFAKNCAVGEGGEPDVGPVPKTDTHTLAAENAGELRRDSRCRFLETIVVQACGK